MPRRSNAPIAVLLLPQALEAFALREQAQALLRAPGVVAIEPGVLPSGLVGRVSERTAARMARGQARRLHKRLPGRTAAVLLFDALQWPLAGALAARTRAEVWYGPVSAGEDAPRRLELHEQAAAGASLLFAADEVAVLRERLAGLGVAIDR